MDGRMLETLVLDTVARLARAQQELISISRDFQPGMMDDERRVQLRQHASTMFQIAGELDHRKEIMSSLGELLMKFCRKPEAENKG